jgi:hypothetical protein
VIVLKILSFLAEVVFWWCDSGEDAFLTSSLSSSSLFIYLFIYYVWNGALALE